VNESLTRLVAEVIGNEDKHADANHVGRKRNWEQAGGEDEIAPHVAVLHEIDIKQPHGRHGDQRMQS
jgi:hypothetical protein